MTWKLLNNYLGDNGGVLSTACQPEVGPFNPLHVVCLNASIFVLLSALTPVEKICPKIWAKQLSTGT